MKLEDLIKALADEMTRLEPELEKMVETLRTAANDSPEFMDALERYSQQVRLIGEATDMAGFSGLKMVCDHVVENTLFISSMSADERAKEAKFLASWPAQMVHYLHHLDDPSIAAGLVDRLREAPNPMDEETALRVMHHLGSISNLGKPDLPEDERQKVATAEDVALVLPEDVDQNLFNGFVQEAPGLVQHLVSLSANMVSGAGDSSDVVAAKRVAHTLKGVGATLGLRGLASLGHHIEDIFEYFEEHEKNVAPGVAEVLLDAAYCLEQMVDFVMGEDEYPQQAQGVLQNVLDLAGLIDEGAPLDNFHAKAKPTAPAPTPPKVSPPKMSSSVSAGSGLRVSMDRIEELFRVSGEVSVHSAAMESGLDGVSDRARHLLEQNLRVQKRLFELETLVDVRALAMMRGRSERDVGEAFDPLEMDQYNELHSTVHALVEEAADARVLAQRLEENLARLLRMQTRQDLLARDLQHLVISTRMAEVGSLQSRLQRNVRTTCQATDKQAELVLEGGDTLIDNDVLNHLAEPLLHLIRNAIDHGIETPDERVALGKDPSGRITLSFNRQGQQVVMSCSDDGRGLDYPRIAALAVERGLIPSSEGMSEEEISRLLLTPGFSSRETVSEISGRGVGLDVVREWVTRMNGSMSMRGELGKGCTVELRFAASLSTIQSLIVGISGERFALPSVYIEQAISRGEGHLRYQGKRLLYQYGENIVSALHLADLLNLPRNNEKPLDEYDIVVVVLQNKRLALTVDQLIDSRELLVNPPGRFARHLNGVTGLSILGDGSIAVNIDMQQLLQEPATGGQFGLSFERSEMQKSLPTLPGVLIVDDSLSVRTGLEQLVRDSGYRTATARDGLEAIDIMKEFQPDIVLTDLEMPNMNGIELTQHIRHHDDMSALPVIMITSRSQDKHRQLANDVGVDVYITKPYSDGELLRTIRQSLKEGHYASA